MFLFFKLFCILLTNFTFYVFSLNQSKKPCFLKQIIYIFKVFFWNTH